MFKINKRPKDDSSGDESESSQSNGEHKEQHYKMDTNIISIFLWFDWPIIEKYYVGSHGQASYSYASPDDIIIAYNFADMDKEWFLWLLDINQLSPIQFLWSESKTLLPKDILNNDILLRQISMIIKRRLQRNKKHIISIKPFSGIYPEIHPAINKIKSFVGSPYNKNITKCIAEFKWTEQFANKSCLHRYFANPNKPSLFQICNIFTNGLSQYKGYVCSNKDEILAAYDTLIKVIGHSNVVIKECYGDGGCDIFFYSSKDEIIDKFIWKEYFTLANIEENLTFNAQYEIDKIEYVGIQFYENEVIGCGLQKFIDNSIFIGSQKYTNKWMKNKLKQITANVMKKIGAKHVGGFDFAVQYFKDWKVKPKIYLIDMNTARYTEVTQSAVIQRKFQINEENIFWIMRNLSVKSDASFQMIMNDYSELLFNTKSKNGVYFHSFHPKNECAVVSIFGDNTKHVFQIFNKLMSIDFIILKK